MNKTLKYVLIAVGAVIVLLLLIPLFINANSFRPTIEQKMTAARGRKVQVGNLGFSLFSGSLSAATFPSLTIPSSATSPL